MAPQPTVDDELPAYSVNPEAPKPAAQPAWMHQATAATSTASAPESPPTGPPPSAESPPEEVVPPLPSRSKFWKLAKPLALVVGAGMSAGTTYALVKRVQHLIANASVDSNPETWMTEARERVYDPCYIGCNDCNDPSYAWTACQRTAQLDNIPQGVICDANVMWNWADRYPDPCLRAVGDVLRAKALAKLKQSYRNQLALIILTILAGLVGGLIVYCLIRRCARKRDKKAALARSRPPAYSEKAPGAGKRKSLKLLLATFLGLFGRKATAYACTGHADVSDQFFLSPNGTISGVIHGWFSDCFDQTYCYDVCSSSCTSDAYGAQSCSESCYTSCYTVTYTRKTPREYVLDMVPKVEACGFRMVESPPSPGTIVPDLVRVANANIEKDHWVKIAVSGYNVTRSDYTDDEVLCLHGIGGDTGGGAGRDRHTIEGGKRWGPGPGVPWGSSAWSP